MATVVALYDCPADTTSRVFSSLDLIDDWGLNTADSTEWPACDSER
jgi:hypothetical protein